MFEFQGEYVSLALFRLFPAVYLSARNLFVLFLQAYNRLLVRPRGARGFESRILCRKTGLSPNSVSAGMGTLSNIPGRIG